MLLRTNFVKALQSFSQVSAQRLITSYTESAATVLFF
jgi:hypothetical protein